MKKVYTLVLAFLIGSATMFADEPNYPNLVPTGDFEGITSVIDEGWALANGDAALMEILDSDNTLDENSTKMLKLVTPADATSAWHLQLFTPVMAITIDYEYSIEFQIRSDVDGQGRISSRDDELSSQYLPDFFTTTEWQSFSYGPFTAIGEELRFAFDLGYIPDVVYYLDNVKVFDHTTATSIEIPLVKEVVNVYSTNGNINIVDAAGKNVEVFSITGVSVYSAIGSSETLTIPLSGGIYFVVVNDVVTKVLVK